MSDQDYSILYEVGPGYFPYWSPDGTKISYLDDPKEENRWRVLSYKSAEQSIKDYQIPSYYWFSHKGFWHPDGDKILMLKSGDVQHKPDDLAVIDLSTSEIAQLTNSEDCERDAKWSPLANDEIAYLDTASGKSDLYWMDTNGGNQKNLSHSIPGHVTEFDWSPDGKHIIFVLLNSINHDFYHQELFMLNIEDETIRQLTSTNDADEFNPVWSPDGNKIAYFIEKNNLDGKKRKAYELHILDVHSDNSQLLNKIDW